MMAHAKKYTMRPARQRPDGELQPVYFNGKKNAIAREETMAVTPDLHRAFMAGDLEIDGYQHTRKGSAKPAKKRAAKKRAAKKTPKPAENLAAREETEEF